jgi:hypothetical protein
LTIFGRGKDLPGKRANRSTAGGRSDDNAPPSEFNLRKAAFEIVIVAVGVLLALGVDEIRESRANQSLVAETEKALRGEVEENRIRLITKLDKIDHAYQALEANPAIGPVLVEKRANFQIETADAAWTMAQQTEALRLMDAKERQAFASVYASHNIYNRILGEEMTHWSDLAASAPNDRSVIMWKAYARRVGGAACFSLMRIERFRNPTLPITRLQRGCADYSPSVPPDAIYRRFGLEMPSSRWQPGSDF